MSRFQLFLRRLWDRLRGRWYEGPEPPPRLAQEVEVFRLRNPAATVAEWQAFTTRFVQNSYRDGFIRGLEWNERLWPGPATDPEVLAEASRHDWSLPLERLEQQRRGEAYPSPIVGMTARDAAQLQHHLANAGATLIPVSERPGPRAAPGGIGPSPYPRRRF